MADKQLVVPMDFNLKEAKEFVFESLMVPGAAATIGRVYYHPTLQRVQYTSKRGTGDTLYWVTIPRIDSAENVAGLWNFNRSATAGPPFTVVSNKRVDNLNAQFISGFPAQAALGAEVIPVRTKRTGTQGAGYDGHIIVPLTPIEENHAASRYFVEQLLHGNVEKPACRVASTRDLAADFDATAGTLTSTVNTDLNRATIDGVGSLVIGDRVLVLGEGYSGVLSILGSDNAANGIYTVTALGADGASGSKWVMTRAEDMDSDVDVQDGASVFVAQGNNLGQTQWSLITHRPIDLNTDALQFTRTSGTRTAHTHPAGEITSASPFRDSTPYTFRGALIVGSSYFSSGTGIFFGESVSTNNDAARIIQVANTRTLQIRGNPLGSQALLNLNATGPNVADPMIKAVKNHGADRGTIKFSERATIFGKPIQPPENPTTAAWGTLHRTTIGSGSNTRKKPQWQTTGSITHAVARKYETTITPNGELGTDAEPFPVDHNLGTREVVVQVRRVSDYKEVIVETKPLNDNRVTVSFGIAPADNSGNYKVIVIG